MTDGYVSTPEPPTVAVVLSPEGEIIDRCYTWEAGQNYALHEGLRVIAVADDGGMTIDFAQQLYDAELARHDDCFGAVVHHPAA